MLTFTLWLAGVLNRRILFRFARRRGETIRCGRRRRFLDELIAIYGRLFAILLRIAAAIAVTTTPVTFCCFTVNRVRRSLALICSIVR